MRVQSSALPSMITIVQVAGTTPLMVFCQRSSTGESRLKAVPLCVWHSDLVTGEAAACKAWLICNPVVETIHLCILTWIKTVITFMEQWKQRKLKNLWDAYAETMAQILPQTPFSLLFYSISQSDGFAYLTLQ